MLKLSDLVFPIFTNCIKAQEDMKIKPLNFVWLFQIQVKGYDL